MTDVVVETLRIRGPHARRLASVAARTLPAALDRALADVPDVTVPSIHVLLDLDVSQYDDETLATLWADAIRAEVLAAVPTRWAANTRSATRQPPTPSISRPAEQAEPTDQRTVLADARHLLDRSGSTETAVPTALLRLGDPEIAAFVATTLGRHDWSRLLRSLSSALAPPPQHERGLQEGLKAGGDQDPAARARAAPVAPSGVDGAAGNRGRLTDHAVPLAPASEQAGQAGHQHATLALLAALDGLMPLASEVIDPATVTRAAGLVLLYPWLAEHCRRAERLHPWLDPLDVREAALGALIAPDDASLGDDVLVGFLAGRTDMIPRRDRTRVPLTRERDVLESAAEVLTSYASLLPGFERSSAQFIRENWIARLGVLDLNRDPALLTAATHPLDVVLPRLPYPMGLLKLPWSPPLSIRFRP